ncbi:TPA: hypothetical protein DDW69_01400 [candidate division CPR2 bacterium]|uniref:Prophage LambdaCh01 nuclease domain-containing protein n=1 Tax=candidate division CPR2 bacterium GW2011_GWC1_41_48 TaxID=1618344 RepID=A0A0G0W9K5_UNCC2|nr:MAG: Micrococcal nuclease-like protein nuclease [candidate division CPR2 bacterium GW2011_GWC2_39_35]KKR27616.1 MAG: Micrococcal nuclease-like protein nuclease [candidate division CPR2 bacterium GW2011_GWD2_39_7]KKR28264.1 MAG: Micrococcal nuclease-like protein nuclease [candidate division CPR2 bacterium GW2011_GWD1_39_7]KKS09679.1 MAG: Prophage LambdaCh01 nuclease domain-containing protein [candidate division CPR2 bacterium GW2011_GWC1_41_48]HBG81476.1 hypothetical protein [candidate divisi
MNKDLSKIKHMAGLIMAVLFIIISLYSSQYDRSGVSDDVAVKKVVDGDTVILTNDEKVRYIGIDTPETKHPKKEIQCFGKEAAARNKELVEGKKVKLERDISERDKYGRLLRYVYLEDSTFVNLLLVKEGYARASTYPPDIKHQNDFLEAEREARGNNRGLWNAEACN